MSDFLGRYTGTLVAEQLRREWLIVLGKRQQWELLRRRFPNLVVDDAEVTCYSLQARWRRGDRAAVEEFRRVWASARELPEACVPIAESEIAAGRLTARHVWDRARMLLQADRMAAAKRVVDYLPAGEMPDDRTLDSVRSQPARFIERAEKLDLKKRTNRELLVYAFARLARSDLTAAAGQWTKKLQERLPPEDQASIWSHLATQAARQHDPRALEWFANADTAALADEQLEWRVRAALRHGEWLDVRTTIEKMTPAGRSDPAWVYWQGRALRQFGQRDEADQLRADRGRASFLRQALARGAGAAAHGPVAPRAADAGGHQPSGRERWPAARRDALPDRHERAAGRRGARGAVRRRARMELVAARDGRP